MGQSRSRHSSPYSVEKFQTRESSFSSTYIHPEHYIGPPILPNGSRTIYDSYLYATSKFGDSPFLGTRSTSQSGRLGPYVWKTYSEVFKIVKVLTSCLKKLNIFSRSCKYIVIICKNREEMVYFELSCMSQNIPVVPLADNLGSDVLSGVFLELKPEVLVCGGSQCEVLTSLPESSLTSIKKLIILDAIRGSLKSYFKGLQIEVYEYQDILKVPFEEIKDRPPSPDDLLCIVYTSGTNGYPKGAMILHKNAISAVLFVNLGGYEYYNSDCYLMYMSNAHIFNRIMTYLLINSGARIGMYSGDILNIKDDLMTLKPTVFASVPRIFNRFYFVIKQRFEEKSGMMKKILKSSLKSKTKKFNSSGNLKNGFWEKIAFKKAIKSMGGKVRLMLSGSAPMNQEILDFLRIVFSCPISECYGLTEVCGPCFITRHSDTRANHIGGPFPGIEAKIRAIPELCLREEEEEKEKIEELGELCIKGQSLFAGYFKSQDVTDVAVDSDGWYYTGDIVKRNPADGSFRIIDRLSNIIKLSQGEFVSLEKVETALLKSQYVHQVFVYGDGFHHYLVAVIVLNKELVLEKWLAKRPKSRDWSRIIRDRKMNGDILEDLRDVSISNQLSKNEIVQRVYLEENEWTDRDLLTSSMKLNRFKAKEKYREAIENMFDESQVNF